LIIGEKRALLFLYLSSVKSVLNCSYTCGLGKNGIGKFVRAIIVGGMLLASGPGLMADDMGLEWNAAREKWDAIAQKMLDGDEAATQKFFSMEEMAARREIGFHELAVLLNLHAYFIRREAPDDPRVKQYETIAAEKFGYPLALYNIGEYEKAAEGGVTSAALALAPKTLPAFEKAESTEAKVWLLDRALHYYQRVLDTNPSDSQRATALKHQAEIRNRRQKLPATVFPATEPESKYEQMAIYAELDAMNARMPLGPPVNPFAAMCGNEPALYPAQAQDIHAYGSDQYNQAVDAYNAHRAWSNCHATRHGQVLDTIKAMPGSGYNDIKYRPRKSLVAFLLTEKSKVEREMLQSAPKLQAEKASSFHYVAALGGSKRKPYGDALDARSKQLEQIAVKANTSKANRRPTTRYRDSAPARDNSESKGDRYQRQRADYDRCMYYAESSRAAGGQAYAIAADKCRPLYPDGN
jgi:hypothetical protein